MRVIAGRLRGRTIRSAPGRSTRPTSGRARGGLFDWLGPDLEGARVLDLFAGTGAVGIEALSRGAAHVTFVESSRACSGVLRRNLRELGVAGACRVLTLRAQAAVERLSREGIRFDLVFADPPYHDPDGVRLPTPEALGRLLGSSGRVVVERSRRAPDVEAGAGLVPLAARTYGETRFTVYVGSGGPVAAAVEEIP